MSLQLAVWRLALRLVARPRLARASTPQQARRDFLRASRWFRPPPFLLHLRGAGLLHRITAGPVDEHGVILWCHGGAYLTGSPDTHAAMLGRLSRLSRLAVLALDYRKAPEHPAPAAFDDARAAHATLMAQGWAPGQIVLGGDSAGGGLAFALMADLCRRDLRPAGLIAFSPWTDMTMSSPSLRDCAASDPLLPVARFAEAVDLVRGALSPGDPRLSPVLDRFDRPPPVLIQVGRDEILRDDSRRMAALLRAAGGRVLLQEVPGVPHVWHILDGYLPEARAALREAARFAADQAATPETSR